jgi:3-phosphoshikimate 1-carboxyvinyltransferase
LAALAEGESTIEGALDSDDTRHMKTALRALGVGVEDLDATTLRVHGGRSRLRAPGAPLFVGNSGTTVRFLTALSALVPGTVTLVGDEHMAERPIQDLTDALAALGVRVECPTGCPPVTIHGGALPGGRVVLRGDRSSQYFSALLMAGGLASAPLEICVEGGLVSRPYVEITLRMCAQFAGFVTHDENRFTIRSIASYRAHAFSVEPDASSASYPFALAAASGGRITVDGLGSEVLQGDVAFTELLEQAGARVVRSPSGTRVEGALLRGIDADMHHISDTVMTLAAIAPVCEGATTIRNVGNIRIKETDRLAATVAELGRLGQVVSHGEDWLRIEPRPLVPATVRCYGDHRMAMSFAILGAVWHGVAIEDPACVAKTSPGFWDDLARCYEAVGAPRPF